MSKAPNPRRPPSLWQSAQAGGEKARDALRARDNKTQIDVKRADKKTETDVKKGKRRRRA
jgi:hypothetical protein